MVTPSAYGTRRPPAPSTRSQSPAAARPRARDERIDVDPDALGPRRQGGGGWQAEGVRTNTLAGNRLSGGPPQGPGIEGIGVAAGLYRLERDRPQAAAEGEPQQAARNGGLADAGVGSDHKQATRPTVMARPGELRQGRP